MPSTIQTPQQINTAAEEVSKRILPAVLSNNIQNATAINAYLMRNHMDSNEVVDASADNLHAAIVSLHRQGQLQWDKAPGKIVHERPIKEIDPLGMQSRHNAIEAANKAKEMSDAAQIIEKCRSQARKFTGQSHSISYSGRTTLNNRLDAELKKTPTPDLARALEIEQIMREKTAECHR
jgi:hypothetical protein